MHLLVELEGVVEGSEALSTPVVQGEVLPAQLAQPVVVIKRTYFLP